MLAVKAFLWELGLAYTQDMDVVPLFVRMMPTVFLCLIINGVNKGLLASLRALKMQVLATVILAVTLYGVCLPLSYYFGIVAQVGLSGLWWGFFIAQVLSACVFTV